MDSMSRDRGAVIPKSFRAGTTLAFDLCLPAFDSTNGWAAKIVITQCGKKESFSLTPLTNQPTYWSASVPASTSENWCPGTYSLFVMVERPPDEKHVACETTLYVLPNPECAKCDKTLNQSQLALVNEAITAVLAGKGVKSYRIETNIGERELERMSLEELRKFKQYLEGLVENELVKMGLKRRSSAWRQIGTRFRR